MTQTTTGHASFDDVNHPVHYNAHPSGLEAIEICRLMPFSLGNAVKYIWRTEHKNGDEDLKKARWYLRDHLAHESEEGVAWAPSLQVLRLLREATAADPVVNRRVLLQFITAGYFSAAANLITKLLGDSDE